MTDSQIARAEIARLIAENERLRSDCVILLANLDHLEECTGEGPEGEDRAIVDQIRARLFGAPTDATALKIEETRA